MFRPTFALLFTTLVLLFSSFASAWPWPRFLPHIDSLVVRQDSASSSGTAQPTPAPSPTTGAANTGSNTAAASTAQKTGSASGSATGSVTDAPKGTATTGNGSGSQSPTDTGVDTTSYDARLPVGGISMMTPAATLGAQYYKIGEQITFGWNYTSLLATPAAINVFATGKDNSALYTIATNVTWQSSGAATWDTNGYSTMTGSTALAQQTYTLIIFDTAAGISAAPQAGFLAPYKGLTFGMYSPQYPLAADTLNGEVKCATCSGAMSNMKVGMGFVMGMATISVLSFTWFIGGAGVIW